ncbi:hypothetical protein FGG08_005284 [Glutinoglossum americanum]|uniref:Enoyl reductase (ER) domain-containing protein n=1 Tax=Glutinoglossum americanum TaxID=1670608 RepID=A0A9P8I3L6_9PEZI|nr:hypothetical protein FGG08_005284 [Glutinoglossum americanum]
MAPPTTQYAVQSIEQGVAKLISGTPVPKLRDDYILVKTVAVALNPTDWKHVDYLPTPGAIVGCDYAGVVEEVGPAVTKLFKRGDRVAGAVHGSNASQLDGGAFAEYIVAKGDGQIRIPDNVTFEEAATLGIGITTVGQGLYQSLGLQLPSSPTETRLPILIYGGSTATGTLAIQFAKLSGYTVVTTCSPRNFELVKSLGADAAFDYNDPNCAAEIRKFTSNRLFYVFDCISSDVTGAICANAIGPAGGKYSGLLIPKPKLPRGDVENLVTFAYTGLGEGFVKAGKSFPPVPEDYEFQKHFWALTEGLLRDGKFKVHPLHVGEEGLKGVLEGMQSMREDKVSGKKLVYRVAETPK